MQALQQAIETHGLIRPGDRVVVAVSGGADSMALLVGLRGLSEPYRISLTVAHLDHQLRGEASAEDARFVAEQADRMGLPFIGGACAVAERARQKRLSLETAAREARYAFLAEVCRSVTGDAVATGHTRDDQAETVLLRLLRGAGMYGLRGIPRLSVRAGMRLIRPLLGCTRKDVLNFLRTERVNWREDASNANPEFTRNRVRHELLPLLRNQFNPGVVEVLARTAKLMGEEDDWIQQVAASKMIEFAAPDDETALLLAPLRREHRALQRRILRRWLVERGVPAGRLDVSLIERLLDLTSTREGSQRTPVAGGGWVERVYERLVWIPDMPMSPAFAIPLPMPGSAAGPGWRVVTTFDAGYRKSTQHRIGDLPADGWIRRDKALRHSLILRGWRAGDRMQPLGMDGTVRLQDLWVNTKVPQTQRAKIPILTAEEMVVWVPGYRVARGWEVPAPDAPSVHLELAAC